MQRNQDVSYSLLSAVQLGKLDRAKELIDSYGLSYSQAWSGGYVLLRDAVKYKNGAIAKLLLTSGSKVNSRNKKPSDTPLHFAVINGDIEIVKMILDKGANINAKNQNGRTPLHNAIEHEKMELTELLLKHRADVNARDNDGTSVLHVAVEIGCLKSVEHLLKYGANVDCVRTSTRKIGYTPLHFAVEKGSREVVTLLLSRGANVELKGEDDITPLHIAAQKGYIHIAKDLLKHGACTHSFTLKEEYTPLHFAVINGNMEIVEMILDKGANVNAKNQYSRTPIQISIENKKIELTELLLKHRADANSIDNDGASVLLVAVEMGCLKSVENLLKYGAYVNYASAWKKGYTPLHVAVEKGSKEVVTLLLSRSANVELKGEDGITPLHIAAQKGYIHIAADLLEHGACTHSFTLKEGYTPLHFASQIEKEVVKLLLNKGADINARTHNNLTPLIIATKAGHRAVVKLLLQHGAQVDNQDKDGKTALHLAVEKGYSTIVEDILKYCPDINHQSNRSSLEIAVLGYGIQYKEIVQAFLEYGLIVNPGDANNPKLLHAAVEKGYLKIVEDLLKYGADVNSKFDGYTPLHIAAMKKQEEAAKLLISYGADINAQDRHGRTPIFYAIRYADLKITKILLTNGANIKDSPGLLNFAVRKDCVEIVEVLLQHDADINARDECGRTALNSTVLSYCEYEGFSRCFTNDDHDINITVEMAELLLSKGANVDAKTTNGETTLHAAIQKGYSKVVEALLKYNADVNSGVESGITPPLHLSAQRGNEEVCRMLLNKGANVNAKQEDGITALHIATREGHKEVVKVLLECGAKVDSKTKSGMTPLHLGAEKLNVVEIIETILKFGANIDSRDDCGRTPLHIASQKRHHEVIATLLKYGSDINITSGDNHTPLDYALDGIRFYMDDDDDDDDYGGDDYCCCFDDHKHDDHSYEAIEAFELHILKMETANLYLSESNLLSMRRISDGMNPYCITIESKLTEYDCKKEIASMKSEKINNLNITFYNFLAKGTRSLARYMRYENIVQVLKSVDYKTKFPIYASMIESNFRKGMERKELLEQADKIFHILFSNFPKLPYDCTEEIFSYLNNEDLRNLMDTCEPLSIRNQKM